MHDKTMIIILLVFRSNCLRMPILYRLQDIAIYWSKIDISHTCIYRPPFEMTLSEFRRYIWREKNRMTDIPV